MKLIPNIKNITWIPAFAGMTGEEWIPVFTGMTFSSSLAPIQSGAGRIKPILNLIGDAE